MVHTSFVMHKTQVCNKLQILVFLSNIPFTFSTSRPVNFALSFSFYFTQGVA